jgi:hypothetical protein
MKLIYPLSSTQRGGFDELLYSRTILALGKAAQEIFSTLSVGIISLGGLGCIVAELLARLGVRSMMLCEYDLVEDSNLNRLLGARFYDGQLKTPKVLVAARNILSVNPNINLELVQGDFLLKENQEKLKSNDINFGCSDSNAVRLATNRLCLACGIPYFDLGTGAIVKRGKLKSAGGQVILVRPGHGFCLQCGNFFDLQAIRVEFMDPEEAKRQRGMGYVKGEYVPRPSVYALNMMVASWAVWMMMRYVVGEDLGFDGVYVDAVTFESKPWVEEKREDCSICGKDGIVFRGDDAPLITRESFESSQLPQNPNKSSTKNQVDEDKTKDGSESG